jgi:hypothetical protein
LNYLIAKVLFSVGAGDRPIGAEFSIQASSTALKKVKQNRRSGKKQQLIYQWTSRDSQDYLLKAKVGHFFLLTKLNSGLFQTNNPCRVWPFHL